MVLLQGYITYIDPWSSKETLYKPDYAPSLSYGICLWKETPVLNEEKENMNENIEKIKWFDCESNVCQTINSLI